MKNRFDNWKPPVFNKKGMTKWNWMCQYNENLLLGNRVDVGSFTYINARYGVEIQDDVEIGSHCSIYSHSTIDNKKGKVTIEKGAKIGTHSTVMPGITIGENAIIGAYSFINKNVPPGVIAYGVPLKIIKKVKNEY